MISQILYEDGDVEVLNLEKERWELIDTGGKPTKVLRISGFWVLLSIFYRSFQLNKYSYSICTYCRSPEHQRGVLIRKGNTYSLQHSAVGLVFVF